MSELKRFLSGIRYDKPMLYALLVFAFVSCIILYSASDVVLRVFFEDMLKYLFCLGMIVKPGVQYFCK